MSTLPAPQTTLQANTAAYESLPLVKPTGFREYDARWLFEKELNLMGVHVLGLGLATLIHEQGVQPELVTGHDYRSYSSSIKYALISGLMAGGVKVKDIGLAMTPMAYYAQFALNTACVAMVTASHNDNGWTGVKMGTNKPLTFGPVEMTRLKEIVMNNQGITRSGGGYEFIPNFAEQYAAHLTNRPAFTRKIRAVVACGNGTAGAFAPQILEKLGIEVIPMDCTPDHSFPRYNPNPEDLEMLHAMAAAVKEHKADLALGFDGDGDRCGVVDENGHEIFADRLGVMLARDIAAHHPGSTFVVDVKSTGLYATDPVLKERGAQTDYWKTGHSYIKRRTAELGAIAGFEKSGHFFFNAPYGLGYDDALVSALTLLQTLENNPGKSIGQLVAELPETHQSPTMSPHCPDEEKYGVVEQVVAHFQKAQADGATVMGQPITSVNTVNGVRVTVQDGTWGLIRASSNKPELVVVVESPVSKENRNKMFEELDTLLQTFPSVGEYNQKLA